VSRSRRPLAALVLLPLVAFLVAACGSGGAMSLDPVASAATKTVAAKTFKATFTAQLTAQGQSFSFSGGGVVDDANGAADLTMDFASLPLPQGQGKVELRFVDGAMYMNLPFLAGSNPGGKPWLKIDIAKAASALGLDLGSFRGVDPDQGLKQLLAAGDVQKVGEETIDGEQMTHYYAVVDVARAAQLKPQQRAALRKALQGMNGSAPVDVWIDDQGRVRRETMSIDYGKALDDAHMTMTFDFSDFGVDVSVEAPPADQVLDLSNLVAKSLRTGTH
jgi:uncharacterized membrane protein